MPRQTLSHMGQELAILDMRILLIVSPFLSQRSRSNGTWSGPGGCVGDVTPLQAGPSQPLVVPGQFYSVEGKLKINEIYLSVQGESTWAGLPCVFVRLTGCDSRCSYCDTEYAFYEGSRRSLDEVFGEVLRFECPLVEITGGEPLAAKERSFAYGRPLRCRSHCAHRDKRRA